MSHEKSREDVLCVKGRILAADQRKAVSSWHEEPLPTTLFSWGMAASPIHDHNGHSSITRTRRKSDGHRSKSPWETFLQLESELKPDNLQEPLPWLIGFYSQVVWPWGFETDVLSELIYYLFESFKINGLIFSQRLLPMKFPSHFAHCLIH